MLNFNVSNYKETARVETTGRMGRKMPIFATFAKLLRIRLIENFSVYSSYLSLPKDIPFVSES